MQEAILDYRNAYGHGVGGNINSGTVDRSEVCVLSKDVLSFLENHYLKLSNDYFYYGAGRLEAFQNNPLDNFGSVNISPEGVKVEAVSVFCQMFSVFDQYYFGYKRFLFIYQIKVAVDESHKAKFKPF